MELLKILSESVGDTSEEESVEEEELVDSDTQEESEN